MAEQARGGLAVDPATSYLKRVRRVALVTKIALGVVILAGLLVTGGYYLQYRHSADPLGPAQVDAAKAATAYAAASDADSAAAANADAAKAAYQAQQKLELEATGYPGSKSASMIPDMVSTRNALAEADAALSDAATTRDGTAMALHLTEAYVNAASDQLLLAAIGSGIVVIIAAAIAFFASMSASKARAMVALARVPVTSATI